MKISELIDKLIELKRLANEDVEVICFQCDRHGYAEFGDPNPKYTKPFGFDKEVVFL